MATPKLGLTERSSLDADSQAMIYQGASSNQLAAIFNMRRDDVLRRLAGLDPVGVGRQGNPIYKLSEAAARLVKIPVTDDMITRHLRRMNPKELPPALNKLFWDGMAARRKYEEQVGELWNTADVLTVLSETFQSLRMSLLLIPDTLMSETDLSEKQLRMAQTIVDNALEEARERLISDVRKPGERRESGGRGPGPVAEEGEL